MSSLPTTRLTEEQYLTLERAAETKSEFYDGQMYAMAGGTPTHSLLANNMGAILRSGVSKGCRTYNSDLRVKIASARMYTYADCTVVCGALQYDGDHRDVIVNPLLLVEVLSPSTEAYDRGKKFELYRTIPTFQEYLLVHQDRVRVEHYSRQDDGSWLLREYSDNDAALAITRMNIHIALTDLYAGAQDEEASAI
jgi:Uma2 family endonuclease